MNRRALGVIIAIAGIAAASTWLSRQSRQPEPAATARAAPDYFARDVVAVVTGADGRHQQQLRARRMEHLPDTDVLTLSAPHLTVYRDGRPWQASAEQGRIATGGERVTLNGDVRLEQGGPRPLQLRTRTLQIYPERQYAETTAPLTLTSPEARVEAIGLEADMRRQKLTLLSNVRGVYDTPAR